MDLSLGSVTNLGQQRLSVSGQRLVGPQRDAGIPFWAAETRQVKQAQRQLGS